MRRTQAAREHDIIIASLQGGDDVKRLLQARETTFLLSDHPLIPPIAATTEAGFQVWGVVPVLSSSRASPDQRSLAAATQEPGKMSRHVIALIDAASFYVSVETAFDASLHGCPVTSCLIVTATSWQPTQQRSKCGLQRGMAYFQCRALIRRQKVVTFSSNYTLYQDASDRVMQVLAAFAEERNGRQLENTPLM